MRKNDVASVMCRALGRGRSQGADWQRGRGLHSFTFQLNLSRV